MCIRYTENNGLGWFGFLVEGQWLYYLSNSGDISEFIAQLEFELVYFEC